MAIRSTQSFPKTQNLIAIFIFMKLIDKIKYERPDLFIEQICKICGKKFLYKDGQIKKIYSNLMKNKINFICCCKSHTTKFQLSIQGNPYSRKDVILKRQETLFKRYGVKHNSQIKGRKEKIRNTCLNNIDKNGLNSYQRGAIKGRITKLNNIDEYGLNSYQRAAIKCKNSKLNDIDENGLNGFKRTFIKSKHTKLIKYNNENYNNRDKCRNTMLQRYGKDGYNNRELCRKTKLQRYGDENYNNRPKMKETLLELTGFDNISKTKWWKDLIHSKQEEIQQKVYETKKKNGTLGTSNMEDMIYQFLIYKFDFEDVIHHHRDEKRYPFECDFYIKPLDLFIELNFFWTHGGEPFDKNNSKHQERLNNWIKSSQEINFKQKKKDGYKNAIYIWTIDDTNKLLTFKRNNLNYKIFYNLEEFLDWFDAIQAVNFEN